MENNIRWGGGSSFILIFILWEVVPELKENILVYTLVEEGLADRPDHVVDHALKQQIIVVAFII